MTGADLLAFTILAWPAICGLLYALRWTGRALYRTTRTRRTR